MNMNDHSGFKWKNHKLDQAQIFLSRSTGKQTVVHPYSGILLSNRKEQTTDTHNRDESDNQRGE